MHEAISVVTARIVDCRHYSFPKWLWQYFQSHMLFQKLLLLHQKVRSLSIPLESGQGDCLNELNVAEVMCAF